MTRACDFLARCSSCMSDLTVPATACPACGSKRLVVLRGSIPPKPLVIIAKTRPVVVPRAPLQKVARQVPAVENPKNARAPSDTTAKSDKSAPRATRRREAVPEPVAPPPPLPVARGELYSRSDPAGSPVAASLLLRLQEFAKAHPNLVVDLAGPGEPPRLRAPLEPFLAWKAGQQ